MRLRVIIAIVVLLLLVVPAHAADYDTSTTTYMVIGDPPPPGATPGPASSGGDERIAITDRGSTGGVRWTSESLGQLYVTEEASAASPFCGTYAPAAYAQTTAAQGVVDFAWIPGTRPDGTPDPYAYFCLEQAYYSTHYAVFTTSITFGQRVDAAPPPTLPVFITQPAAGTTVKGTVWIVLWVAGTSGTSNTFTLSADGQQVSSQTTSARGPVSIPWPTKPVGKAPVPNGTHTLTGTVRDASGNTGSTSITVIVSN